MKSSEYWQRRMMAVEQLSYDKSLEYWDDLERQYKAVSESIQSDITRWYQRFADNNQISMAEAKKLLNSRDLKEFRWSVEEYIKHGRKNLDGKWTKQLENASARVHISRLEALQVQLQQHIEELYGNQLDGLDKLLRDVYTTGYDHTMFEVQRGLNLGWSFQRFNEDQLDAVLKRPWTTDEQTFRDRCWTQKETLVSNLQKNLVQAFIRGDALDKVSTALAKEMHVARSKAARLVQTEASYFANNAQKQCYKDLDVEQVEVVETLDSRTCGTCGSMDGKVIKLSDAEPGITVPPYHPNCRGCTAPYFEDDVGERIARNDEGETYYVPSDMTFEQWEKTFADGNGPEFKDDFLFGKKKEKGIGKISSESQQMIDSVTQRIYKDFPEIEKISDSFTVVHQGEGNPASAKLTVLPDGTVHCGLEINADMWDNVDKVKALVMTQSRSGGHVTTSQPESILFHEFGHMAHNALALQRAGYIKGQRLSEPQIKILMSARNKVAQEVYLEAFNDESFEEIQDIIANTISNRAKYAGEEFIAECFSQYYSGKPTNLSECIVKYFEKQMGR